MKPLDFMNAWLLIHPLPTQAGTHCTCHMHMPPLQSMRRLAMQHILAMGHQQDGGGLQHWLKFSRHALRRCEAWHWWLAARRGAEAGQSNCCLRVVTTLLCHVFGNLLWLCTAFGDPELTVFISGLRAPPLCVVPIGRRWQGSAGHGKGWVVGLTVGLMNCHRTL